MYRNHIISNMPNRITYSDVLPCPTISDPDAPYMPALMPELAGFNLVMFLRNEKTFDEKAFTEDFSTLPLNLVYTVLMIRMKNSRPLNRFLNHAWKSMPHYAGSKSCAHLHSGLIPKTFASCRKNKTSSDTLLTKQNRILLMCGVNFAKCVTR